MQMIHMNEILISHKNVKKLILNILNIQRFSLNAELICSMFIKVLKSSIQKRGENH